MEKVQNITINEIVSSMIKKEHIKIDMSTREKPKDSVRMKNTYYVM